MPWFKVYIEARTDKKLAHLTLAERGVWINLLSYASEQDERGAFDASNRRILAMECAERDMKTLDRTLQKLQEAEHLVCVEGREGWLRFRTFSERQARKPSDEPSATAERQRRSRASRKSNAVSHAVTRDSVTNGDVTRLDRDIERDNSSVISNRGGNISVLAPNVTPMQRREGEGATAPRRKSTQNNPLWDVLVEVFYQPSTKDERSIFGKVARELREMGATPDDVRARAKQHSETCDWDLTPTALMKHWTTLGRKPNPSRPRTSQNGHDPMATNTATIAILGEQSS